MDDKVRKSARIKHASEKAQQERDRNLALDIAIEQDLISSAVQLKAITRSRNFLSQPDLCVKDKQVRKYPRTPIKKFKKGESQLTLPQTIAKKTSELRRSETIGNLSNIDTDAEVSFVTACSNNIYRKIMITAIHQGKKIHKERNV